jgi:hypothetical protein
MLTIITSLYKNEAPRQYNSWNTLIQTLKTRTQTLVARQLVTPGKLTSLITLMKRILNLIDYNYLFKQSNDFDRWSKYFTYMRNELQFLYDPVMNGKGYRNLIITGKTNDIINYIIPTTVGNVIRDLPIGQDWNYWQYTKALKLINHSSDEYTVDCSTDYIKFHYNQPVNVIVCLDVVILGFMYFHYLKKHNLNYKEYDNKTFLHRYLFLPLQYDLLEIYLIKIIKRLTTSMLIDESVEQVSYDILSITDPVVRPTSQMIVACSDIIHGLKSIQYNSITSGQFLNSSILLDKSVIGLINHILAYYTINEGRQYAGLTYLRDYDLFDIIFNVTMLNPNKSSVKTLLDKLYFHLQKLYLAKVWTYMANNTVRNFLEVLLSTQFLRIRNMFKPIEDAYSLTSKDLR